MVAATVNFHQSWQVSEPMVLSGRAIRVIDQRPLLTAEDVRLHAKINERLAVVHRERHSLGAKVRRLLFANRLN